MRRDELQYLADTLLIQKIAIMEAGLHKEAGIIDTLKDVGSFIVDTIRNEIDEKGWGSIISFMAPAVFWRIHPLLFVLYEGAQALGLDVDQILLSVVEGLASKITNGISISPGEVDALGRSAGLSQIGAPLESTATDDMLFDLRKLDQQKKLVKSAQFGKIWSRIPFGRGSKGGFLSRIFSVGGAKGKWIIVGIIVWFIKTILAGAGLLTLSTGVKKMLGIDKPKTEPSPQDESSEAPQPQGSTYQAPAPRSYAPKAFGLPTPLPHSLAVSPSYSEILHNNSGKNFWTVPLVNNSTADTMVWWATDIYPELKGKEALVSKNKDFNKVVSILDSYVPTESPHLLIMPEDIKSRKQMVDYFVGSVAQELDKKDKK